MRRAATTTALATASLLVLAGCTSTPATTRTVTVAPTTASTVTSAALDTIDVTPDQAISVTVPGVGTLTGPKGSVTTAGTMKLSAVTGSPQLPAGVAVAGTGFDVAFTGTELAKPLTLTFGDLTTGDAIPLALHQRHDGTWETLEATSTGGHVQLTTKSFSRILPAYLDPYGWVDAAWARIKSGAAGRTSPLTCTGAPQWLDYSTASDMIHACATTNAGRAEVQIKSNRGVTLEVHRPGSPQYVWVQDQPSWVRAAMGAIVRFDPDSTVMLAPGDTVTVGYARPATTQNLKFTVEGRTGKAIGLTLAQDLLDLLTGGALGKNLPAFAVFTIAECGAGLSLSSFHTNPANLADFLICAARTMQNVVVSPEGMRKFIGRFGGSAALADTMRGTLAKAGAAAKVIVVLTPVLQVLVGNLLDKAQSLWTQGSSDTFPITLKGAGAKAPTGGTTGTTGTKTTTPSTGGSSGGPTVAKGTGKVMIVGSSRVDLQACKLEYSIVSPK